MIGGFSKTDILINRMMSFKYSLTKHEKATDEALQINNKIKNQNTSRRNCSHFTFLQYISMNYDRSWRFAWSLFSNTMNHSICFA